MEERKFIASGDIYDVYESEDGKAVRIYRDAKYKEKCLYAALTHARVETTLGMSSLARGLGHRRQVGYHYGLDKRKDPRSDDRRGARKG